MAYAGVRTQPELMPEFNWRRQNMHVLHPAERCRAALGNGVSAWLAVLLCGAVALRAPE
eukprot:COSAG02_NODE_2951_length_7674_cov_3.531881_8_plen_59_part_00